MLTNAAIKSVEPQEKPFTMPDSQGLYLLVKPNGSKLWRFQYRYQGRPHLLALGSIDIFTSAFTKSLLQFFYGQFAL